MIRLDVPQGSPEWFRARVGIPTASQFHRIITPRTMKLSGAVDGYRNELLADELVGIPTEEEADEGSGFMQRGSVMEVEAVAYYELTRDVEVERVGLVLRDDRRVGCSPDAFVGGDGLLEIKCPKASTHVGYMLDGDNEKYRCQRQGQLWIAERRWLDFLSYNPELPPVLVRYERDEVFIKELARCVSQFVSYLDESRDRLIRAGYIKPALSLVLGEAA